MFRKIFLALVLLGFVAGTGYARGLSNKSLSSKVDFNLGASFAYVMTDDAPDYGPGFSLEVMAEVIDNLRVGGSFVYDALWGKLGGWDYTFGWKSLLIDVSYLFYESRQQGFYAKFALDIWNKFKVTFKEGYTEHAKESKKDNTTQPDVRIGAGWRWSDLRGRYMKDIGAFAEALLVYTPFKGEDDSLVILKAVAGVSYSIR